MALLTFQPVYHCPPLGVAEVHVWSFALLPDLKYRSALSSTLNQEERQRAARFRFEADAGRFEASRGLLRNLLGRYLAQPPSDVCIRFGAFGKPKVDGANLQFNVSHTQDVVSFAFSASSPVGIDVETRKPIARIDEVASQCLSDEQLAVFRRLDEHGKARAFFRFWTRKEALIKAIGLGLHQPLKEFDVTFLDEQPPMLIRAESGFGDASDWVLRDVPVSDRHQSSVAARQPTCNVRIIDSLNTEQ